MNTTEHNTLYNTFELTATFDCSRVLYYRCDLEARYDYLIETAKAQGLNIQHWLDTHKQELSALQYLLHKVPQSAILIVAESYRHEYCKNLVESFICAVDEFVAKHIDIEAIARKVADDMSKIEIAGHVFYWINRADL